MVAVKSVTPFFCPDQLTLLTVLSLLFQKQLLFCFKEVSQFQKNYRFLLNNFSWSILSSKVKVFYLKSDKKSGKPISKFVFQSPVNCNNRSRIMQ